MAIRPVKSDSEHGGRCVWATAASSLAFILASALIASGCGSEKSGDPAKLVVTQNFGSEAVGETQFDPLPKGPTVMRLLQRQFNTQTSYGGRFVSRIGSISASKSPPRDWLFYVNGMESGVSAAEQRVAPGDVIQWDYHRWDAAPASKAIVGAFPKSLIGAQPVGLVCAAPASVACKTATSNLKGAGIKLSAGNTKAPGDAATVYVGAWPRLAAIRSVPRLDQDETGSAVFARFKKRGGATLLVPLREDGSEATPVKAGVGVVVAFSRGGDPVSWVVAGTDERGATAAARALTAKVLANKFATVALIDGADHLILGDLPSK